MIGSYQRPSRFWTHLAGSLIISLAYGSVADALEQTSDGPQSTAAQQKVKRTMQIRVVGPDGEPVQGAKVHRSVWTKEPFL